MEVPVIRMCDRDMHASYQGRYGVGGDVYATGGATEWGEGGGAIFLALRGGDLGVVEAGGEEGEAGRVRIMSLTDRLSGSDRVWHKGRPGPVG